MKNAIDWTLLVLGVLVGLTGVYWMATGWDSVQVAGSVMLAGGLVTVAVAWATRRIAGAGAGALIPREPAYAEPAPSAAISEETPVAYEHVPAPRAPEHAASHAPELATAAIAAAGAAAVAHAVTSEAPPPATPEPMREDTIEAAVGDLFADRFETRDEPPAPDLPPPAVASQPEYEPVRARRPSVKDLLQSRGAEPPPAPPPAEPAPIVSPEPPLPAHELIEPPLPPVELSTLAEHPFAPPPPLPIEPAFAPPPVEPAPAVEPEPAPPAPDDLAQLAAEAAQPPEPRAEEVDWLDETARALDRELGRASLNPAPSQAETPEPPPPSPPPSTPSKAPAVIGRYTSGDTNYVMYDDGSIDAHTPDGVMRFASLTELRRFVEQRG